MDSNGWIKLHRVFLDSRLFSRSGNTVKAAIYLLLSANHKPGYVRGLEINRGQCVRSLEQIADACRISKKAVRYAMEQMLSEKFVERDEPFGAHQGHRITICNYDTYQSEEVNKGTRGAPEGNTNKNDKNEKNINGAQKSLNFKPPALEEVSEYISAQAATKNKVPIDPEAFIDFYKSKNWMIGKNKMKDWKAAVRTWFKNQPPANQSSEADPLKGYASHE